MHEHIDLQGNVLMGDFSTLHDYNNKFTDLCKSFAVKIYSLADMAYSYS